ncbi:hypothetical protein [Acidihalobacter yilgarnensis]|uniref:hypothetical protein n=1 Tax=Acidihalobacter yilgarnensis TaxID=2819280 RepID=UPI0018D316A6|nr:hypothetical protein [Acidihalobacter yilgarnensis]
MGVPAAGGITAPLTSQANRRVPPKEQSRLSAEARSIVRMQFRHQAIDTGERLPFPASSSAIAFRVIELGIFILMIFVVFDTHGQCFSKPFRSGSP